MRVGIVGQEGNTQAEAIVEAIADVVPDDVNVMIDEITAAALNGTGVPAGHMADCDLAVSVGGDGTFLYTARAVGGTPILGVNLGEVGFLNAVSPDEAKSAVAEAIELARDGSMTTRELPRLVAQNEAIELGPVVNEFVIQGPRRGPGAGANLEIAVDGADYTSGWADGVIVSTPTGSTAYNLSEGGPLVHAGLSATIVTAMCPTDTVRPIVADGDHTVTITITEVDHGYLIADGRDRVRIEPGTTVTIEQAPEPLRLAGPEIDFFEALDKLD